MVEIPNRSPNERPITLNRVFEMGSVASHGIHEWLTDIVEPYAISEQVAVFQAEAQAFRDNDYAAGNLLSKPRVPMLDFSPSVSVKIWIEDDASFTFMSMASRDSRGALLAARGINVMDSPSDPDLVTASVLQISRGNHMELAPGRENYDSKLLKTIHDRLVAIKQTQVFDNKLVTEDVLVRGRRLRAMSPTRRGTAFAPDVPDRRQHGQVVQLRPGG